MRRYLTETIYNRSWVLDIFVALLLITTIYFLVGQHNLSAQIKDLAEKNKTLNEQTLDLSHQIRDCTEVTGKCYQAGRKNTAATVEQITQVIVFANACSDKPGTQTALEVQKCVADLLKSH